MYETCIKFAGPWKYYQAVDRDGDAVNWMTALPEAGQSQLAIGVRSC